MKKGRLIISLTMLLALLLQGVPVLAHEGEDHAKDDLANMSITQIERETNQVKAQKLRETGIEPGAARSQNVGASERTFNAAAVAADPGISGSWSSVIGTQVVPIFQAVLPNGKVLMWDSVGDGPTEDYPNHTFTRAMVWNPADNTFKRIDVSGYNIFCAGFAHLPNGNILVAGGNKNANLDGIVQTHIFNFRTETWSRGPNMKAGRWYPSVATMANGELAIMGGGPNNMEIYQTNNTIRQAAGFTNTYYGKRVYPFMASRPDAQLQFFGPYTGMYTVNTAGVAKITAGSNTRDGISRTYGSFATYDVGKTLVVGGGSITEGGVANVPTRTAVVVNTNTGYVPTTAATSSMSQGRRQHNATVLADGTVLVTGGMTSTAKSSLVDLTKASTAAELWNPATGRWTVLSSASRIRQYHSTATLLLDGRVLTGGGGICGDCKTAGYLEKNLEYFTPPYLYKKDGSGQLAPRPTIASAPASVNINTNFAVTSAQAATIRKVALVGLSDTTHSVDQSQRYVPLKFTASGTTLTVTGPGTGGSTPPGYYMLFLIDSAGVPSVAKIVLVNKSPRPLMNGIRNPTAAKCIDVPGSTITIRTYIQMYTCNNSNAQAMTRMPNDSTIRVLGNCLDVPGSNFVSGQKIWAYRCNNSNAQKWQFRTDGTIRPVARQTLCLTTTTTALRSPITISGCSNHPRQKWTW